MEGKTKIESSRSVQTATMSAEMAQMLTLLKEQRKSVIDSLKANLPAYLHYKFFKPASEIQLNHIRAALIELDQSPISEGLCVATRKDSLHGFNTFFEEANRIILNIVEPPAEM